MTTIPLTKALEQNLVDIGVTAIEVIYNLPNGKEKSRIVDTRLLTEFLDQLKSNKSKVIEIHLHRGNDEKA